MKEKKFHLPNQFGIFCEKKNKLQNKNVMGTKNNDCDDVEEDDELLHNWL